MRKRAWAAMGGVAVIFVLGCAGMELDDSDLKELESAIEKAGKEIEKEIEKEAAKSGSGDSPSRKACFKYVEHVNSLPCYKNAQIDPKKQCIEALNLAGDTQVDLYECLIEKTQCNGNLPKPVATTDCIKR